MKKKWVDIDVIFTDEYINNKYRNMMTEVPNKKETLTKSKNKVKKKKVRVL